MIKLSLVCAAVIVTGVGALVFLQSPIMYKDTPGRYIGVWRSMWHKYIITSRDVPNHESICEVTGDIPFICKVIHGVENPRLVVESNSNAFYTVRYHSMDKDALQDIVKSFGLVTRKDRRDADVFILEVPNQKTLRKASMPGQIPILDVPLRNDGWHLNGYPMSDILCFLENRLRMPVIDNTGLQGDWNVTFDHGFEAKVARKGEEVQPLGHTGLSLRKARQKTEITLIAPK